MHSPKLLAFQFELKQAFQCGIPVPLRYFVYLLFGLATLSLIAGVALELGAWREQAVLHGPFQTEPETRTAIVPVPPVPWARCCLEVRGDSNTSVDTSRLTAWLNSVQLGPSHVLHEEIRSGRTAGYSHWHQYLYFHIPDNVANDANLSLRLEYRITVERWILFASFYASGALAFGSLLLAFGVDSVTRRWQATDRVTHKSQNTPSMSLPHTRAHLDESPIVRIVVLCILVLVALVALTALIDNYYLFVFEADASTTVALTQAFATVAVSGLPVPSVDPPYFDAQYWVYAAGYLITKAAINVGALDAARLPSNQSVAIFAIRHVNLILQVGSVALVFVTSAKLSRSTLLAFLLGVVFLFDPQLLAIDFLRIDRVILFLLVLLVYISVELSQGRRHWTLDVALGVVTAALIMTKITSVVFLIIPAVVYARQRGASDAPARHVLWFIAGLIVASHLIAVRYVVYGWQDLTFLPRNLYWKLVSVAAWDVINPRTPYLYYNWDFFLPLGITYLGIFLCSLGICLLALLRRDNLATLIVIPLLALSLAGFVAQKHPRGGYHLIPLYTYVIAYAAWLMRDTLAKRALLIRQQPWIVALLLSVALLFPANNARIAYQQSRSDASTRSESINAIRIAPREWLKSNVPAGTRVAIFNDSDWADPPIFDLGYDFSPTLLSFPYLDPVKMGRFRPPNLKTLPQVADVIVLNSFHRNDYLWVMKHFGYDELAAEWESFYVGLVSTYPHIQFKAASQNYLVDQVDVIILNPSRLSGGTPQVGVNRPNL